MMLIQTPGSFVWAASLAARLGKEGWSAWGVYVVSGCLQGSLLVMGIYFELTNRERCKAEGLDAGHQASEAVDPIPQSNGQPSEQTPLLQVSE